MALTSTFEFGEEKKTAPTHPPIRAIKVTEISKKRQVVALVFENPIQVHQLGKYIIERLPSEPHQECFRKNLFRADKIIFCIDYIYLYSGHKKDFYIFLGFEMKNRYFIKFSDGSGHKMDFQFFLVLRGIIAILGILVTFLRRRPTAYYTSFYGRLIIGEISHTLHFT